MNNCLPVTFHFTTCALDSFYSTNKAHQSLHSKQEVTEEWKYILLLRKGKRSMWWEQQATSD